MKTCQPARAVGVDSTKGKQRHEGDSPHLPPFTQGQQCERSLDSLPCESGWIAQRLAKRVFLWQAPRE